MHGIIEESPPNPHRFDEVGIWPYSEGMATPTVKSTYSLDLQTVRALERMARRWKVSKSEALRRSIRAASQEEMGYGSEALDALDRLQRSLALNRVRARAWSRQVRSERRATTLSRRSLRSRGPARR